jgi:hypothetical protein
MRRIARLAVTAVLALAAIPVWIAIPAQASKTCKQEHKAFDVKGTVTGGSLTRDAGKKKTYSRTLVVDVTQTNKNSKAFKGSQSFTLSHVKVSFEHGIDPLSPTGSLAHLQGKLICTGPGYTIKKAELKKPKPKP